MWLAGLIAPVAAATLDSTVAPTQKAIIEFMASTWNFQRFNLVDQVAAGTRTVVMSDLIPRLTWAGCVVAGCLALACLVFQEKDLT